MLANRIRNFFVLAPAVAPTGLYVCTVSAVLALATTFLVTWTAVPFVCAAVFLAWGCGWRTSSAVVATAMGMTAVSLLAPWNTYRRYLPRERSSVQAEVTVVATDYRGTVLRNRGRRTLPARFHHVRPPWARAGASCRGRVMLQFQEPAAYPYGTRLRISGTIKPVAEASFEGDFDYRRYLFVKGIRDVLSVHRVEEVIPKKGWRGIYAAVLNWRDALADRVAAHVYPPEQGALLAAMSLGCRRVVDPGLRQGFLRSGTVHIFAISGLHVGIVALLIQMMLRGTRVPFRTRYIAMPLVLLGYVLLTGAAPSAVRAWVMISVLCLSRFFLRPGIPLNTVAVAAWLLLLWNPLNVLRIGFLFSFTIVLVLVLGWQRLSSCLMMLEERCLWMPRRVGKPRGRQCVQRYGLRLGLGAGLAWAGSAGLVASVNGLLIPGTVLMNMLLAPVITVTLFIAFLKLGVSLLGLGWLDVLFGAAAGKCLGVISGLSFWGGTFPASVRVPVPDSALVTVYYVLLAALLLPGLSARLRVVFAGAWLFAMFGLSGDFGGERELAVFHGSGTNVPGVVIFEPTLRRAVVVNTGGWRLAADIGQWLKARGCREIELLVLTDNGYEHAAGSRRLLESMTVRSLMIGSENTRTFSDYQRSSGPGTARIRKLRCVELADNGRVAGARAGSWRCWTLRNPGGRERLQLAGRTADNRVQLRVDICGAEGVRAEWEDCRRGRRVLCLWQHREKRLSRIAHGVGSFRERETVSGI